MYVPIEPQEVCVCLSYINPSQPCRQCCWRVDASSSLIYNCLIIDLLVQVIEVAAVCVDGTTGNIISEFQSFVKPTVLLQHTAVQSSKAQNNIA